MSSISDIDRELLISSYEGDITSVLRCIFFGADIEVTVEDTDVTPLILSASKGHGSVVWALIANGADVFKTDKECKTASDYAFENGHMDTYEIINSKISKEV